MLCALPAATTKRGKRGERGRGEVPIGALPHHLPCRSALNLALRSHYLSCSTYDCSTLRHSAGKRVHGACRDKTKQASRALSPRLTGRCQFHVTENRSDRRARATRAARSLA